MSHDCEIKYNLAEGWRSWWFILDILHKLETCKGCIFSPKVLSELHIWRRSDASTSRIVIFSNKLYKYSVCSLRILTNVSKPIISLWSYSHWAHKTWSRNVFTLRLKKMVERERRCYSASNSSESFIYERRVKWHSWVCEHCYYCWSLVEVDTMSKCFRTVYIW